MKRITYEGAVIQVTDDTADDLIGRGEATLVGLVTDVPAVAVDVPAGVVTGALDPPASDGGSFDAMPVPERDAPAAPAKGKGRRK